MEQSLASNDQPDLTSSHLYTFFSISSSDYHSNIFDWLHLVQLVIIMMEQRFIFIFTINFSYDLFYSTFLKVENETNLSDWVHSQGTWPAFHISTSQNFEKCESYPCLFHLSSWPSHLGESQLNQTFFGLGEGLPSPSLGYGSVQINCVDFPTNQQKTTPHSLTCIMPKPPAFINEVMHLHLACHKQPLNTNTMGW